METAEALIWEATEDYYRGLIRHEEYLSIIKDVLEMNFNQMLEQKLKDIVNDTNEAELIERFKRRNEAIEDIYE